MESGSASRRGEAESAEPPATLTEAAERSADPPRVRTVLARLQELHPAVLAAIAAQPTSTRPSAAEALAAVIAASRSLSDAMAADPSLLDVFLDPAELDRRGGALEQSAELDARLAADGDGGEEAVDTLRRWKRRALVRIAARDLTGRADMPEVGEELSAVADAALSAALALVHPPPGMAVIGMGKLGGSELNYASDVDVLFVHDGDPTEAARAARALLRVMAEPRSTGIVFRTDADLRPEGRSGALSRSPEAYGAYYERWAGAWERQALIKARFVAGDADTANRFFDAVRPQLWGGRSTTDAVKEIRELKARSEDLQHRRELDHREVKRGVGGIRDIEFAVQLLQLVHGSAEASIRSPNTLEALDQLDRAGLVDPSDAEHLADAYRHLRTVEHRLQLQDEQQVYALPKDARGMDRLARVMGYRDTPEASAVEQFDATHRRHRLSVRSIHERLFFRPMLEAVSGEGLLDPDTAAERLAAFGFGDLARTRAAVAELAGGFGRSATFIRQILPVLLENLSRSPDPDLGLLQFRLLCDSPPRAAAVVSALRESPVGLDRLSRVLGSSLVTGQWLRLQPEFVDDLADPELLARARGPAEMIDEVTRALKWRGDRAELSAAVRRFARRGRLRVALRDLLDFATPDEVGPELSAVAEAVLAGAVDAAVGEEWEPPRIAVVALGRFGGAELSYASDLDVIFVHDDIDERSAAAAARVATRVLADVGARTAEGQAFEIDARLRPEGRSGPLSLSLDAYRRYWSTRARTWELQSLLRARVVAGDLELGGELIESMGPFVYRSPFPHEAAEEVRAMRLRARKERLRGSPATGNLKLGPGGLVDIEFAVQLLQLRHGAEVPHVREPSTSSALIRLEQAGLISGDDATALLTSYRFCERARNRAWLHTGRGGDVIPSSADDARHLGRMLGFVTNPEAEMVEEHRRLTAAASEAVERIMAS